MKSMRGGLLSVPSSLRCVVTCAAVALCGCGQAPRPHPVAVSAPAVASPPAGGDTVDAALARVPSDALLVGVVDVDALMGRWLPMALGIEPAGDDAKALRKDLDGFVRKHLGVDVSGTKRAVVYAADGKAGGALLLGATGTPTGAKPAGEHEGVAVLEITEDTFVAGIEDGLLVGSRSGVKKMIDISKGRTPAAGTGAAVAALRTALGSVEGAELALAFNAAPLLPALESAKLPPVAAVGMGVGSGEVSGLRVVAVGTREQIGAIESTLTDLRKQAETRIAELRAKEKATGDLGGELGLLGADFALRGVVNSLVVKNEGEVLTLGLPFRALLPVGGTVASAIAIPAIMKRQGEPARGTGTAPSKEDDR